jgi:hypothetical protein
VAVPVTPGVPGQGPPGVAALANQLPTPSGVHCPVFGSRESPSPDRPNSTSLVRTGVTMGIWSVSMCTTLGFGLRIGP